MAGDAPQRLVVPPPSGWWCLPPSGWWCLPPPSGWWCPLSAGGAPPPPPPHTPSGWWWYRPASCLTIGCCCASASTPRSTAAAAVSCICPRQYAHSCFSNADSSRKQRLIALMDASPLRLRNVNSARKRAGSDCAGSLSTSPTRPIASVDVIAAGCTDLQHNVTRPEWLLCNRSDRRERHVYSSTCIASRMVSQYRNSVEIRFSSFIAH